MGKNVQEEKLKIPASLTELDAILDTTEQMMEPTEGGMGLFMVKQYMDRVSYEYKNSQNVVFIEKEWQLDI